MVKKLSYEQLLPGLSALTLRSLVETENGWVVEAEGAKSAVCPTCGVVSHSRHSRYWRRIRDLPLQGTSVTLKLQLGRWRCRSHECVRQIFTERVEGVLVPHAQQTNRLGEILMLMGRALGGRPGQRMLSRLGMPASRHTLLRQMTRAARGSPSKVIRILRVDDWAWS